MGVSKGFAFNASLGISSCMSHLKPIWCALKLLILLNNQCLKVNEASNNFSQTSKFHSQQHEAVATSTMTLVRRVVKMWFVKGFSIASCLPQHCNSVLTTSHRSYCCWLLLLANNGSVFWLLRMCKNGEHIHNAVLES